MVGRIGIIILGPLCKNKHRHRGRNKSLRYASTRQCLKCHKAWSKAYTQLSHVKVLNSKRAVAYYAKNRKNVLVKMAKYRKTKGFRKATVKFRVNNKEKVYAATREWKKKNRAHIREYDRKYFATEEGRLIRATVSHTRRARKLNRHIDYVSWDLICRFRRIGLYHCLYCGKGGKVTVDHLMPLASGGWDMLHNLVPACLSCNIQKHILHPLEFIKRIGRDGYKLRMKITRLLNRYEKVLGNYLLTNSPEKRKTVT